MSESIPANILQEQKALSDSRELKPGQENFYRIWQSDVSPYSNKVICYLNYKGIPYKRMKATMEAMTGEIAELVGRPVIPVLLTPDNRVMQDSTPILEWFETQFTDRAAIPDDASLAFLMWLLEEFADEYMRRIHMNTRWGNQQNRRAVSHRLARGLTFGRADMHPRDLAPFLLERQSGFDQDLGLEGDNVRKSVDQQLFDLMAILEAHFENFQFLLGFRPSLADFALYGSVRGHLYNDPQSNEILEANAPRTCRWIDTMTDLGDIRGCAGQTEFGSWIDLKAKLPESLEKLLAFVGKTYIPVARSGALASRDSLESFEAEVYGERARFSTLEYRVWSFEQLQLRYQALGDDDRETVDQILSVAEVLPGLMSEGIVHNGLYEKFTPPFINKDINDEIPDAKIRHLEPDAARI